MCGIGTKLDKILELLDDINEEIENNWDEIPEEEKNKLFDFYFFYLYGDLHTEFGVEVRNKFRRIVCALMDIVERNNPKWQMDTKRVLEKALKEHNNKSVCDIINNNF